MNYLIKGKEICPTTGTEHLQCYVEFKNAKTLSAAQKVLGGNSHLIISNGTAEENIKYCKKENDYEEFGTPCNQGERKDLLEIGEEIKNGIPLSEIAQKYPSQWIRYERGFRSLKSMMIPKRDWETEVYVFWGSTGTGKTYNARKLFNGKEFHLWMPQMKEWQDGYDGQECVLFEEFRGQIPMSTMLTLLDKYECKVNTKGVPCINWAPRIICITSPKHPRAWYHNLPEDSISQLLRRINSIYNCTEVVGNTNHHFPLEYTLIKGENIETAQKYSDTSFRPHDCVL